MAIEDIAWSRNHPGIHQVNEGLGGALAQRVEPRLGFVPLRGDILAKSKAAVNKIGE